METHDSIISRGLKMVPLYASLPKDFDIFFNDLSHEVTPIEDNPLIIRKVD